MNLELREKVARVVMALVLGQRNSSMNSDDWMAEVRDHEQKRVCVASIPRSRPRTEYDGVWRKPSVSWADVIDQIPAYETDIAAAWLVVDRMASLGWNAEIETGHGLTYCRFKNPEVPVNLDSSEDIWPGTAICLAAVAAIEAAQCAE